MPAFRPLPEKVPFSTSRFRRHLPPFSPVSKPPQQKRQQQTRQHHYQEGVEEQHEGVEQHHEGAEKQHEGAENQHEGAEPIPKSSLGALSTQRPSGKRPQFRTSIAEGEMIAAGRDANKRLTSGNSGLRPFGSKSFQNAVFREDSLQCTKVSPSGSPDALFLECLDSIRHRRYELDPDVDTRNSPAIEKLTQDERNILLKVFQRVDPERQVAPRLESRFWYIDPFWDPFKRVEDLQQQVASDLTEFAKLVGTAEGRRHRLLLRSSLRRHYRMHDPVSGESQSFFASARADRPPVPHRTHERFWDAPWHIGVALKNKNVPVTWRDIHILHHFIGANGLILPRRTTHASRYQQRCIFKAICMARRMALFPYDWKPTQGELMPIMDPLQYLVDELVSRYKAIGDLRADAMLKVMITKYPDLNYHRYLCLKAQLKDQDRQARQRYDEESRGSFSSFLERYRLR